MRFQRRRQGNNGNNHNKNYGAFVEKYMTQITGEISELNGRKACAGEALGLITTKFRRNIEGCYHGLWDSVDTMEPGEFERKLLHDILSNKEYIQKCAPGGCAGYFLKKFSKKIFDMLEADVRDHVARKIVYKPLF